jgi:hypothetical protein
MQPAIIETHNPPYVRFGTEVIEDRTASIAAGHYVGTDVIYAYITPQGSKDQVVRDAQEWLSHIEREMGEGRFPANWLRHFQAEYKAYKEGRELPVNGIPLRQWPAITPATERMFLDLNIRTVEDVAQMNEVALQAVGMAARNWKTRAQEYLTAIGPNQNAERMAALLQEVENLKTANAALASQVAEIRAKDKE